MLTCPPMAGSAEPTFWVDSLGWEAKIRNKSTLILFTEVITFNKGSRAKRYWVGSGTGRAEVRGNCYLLDKSTGEQLYNFQTFGETNWGAFGGGNDKASKGFANRIVNFIKGKY